MWGRRGAKAGWDRRLLPTLTLLGALGPIGCDACSRPEETTDLSDGEGFVGSGSGGSGGFDSGHSGTVSGGSGGSTEIDLGSCSYDAAFAQEVRAELASSNRTHVLQLTTFTLNGPVSSIAGIECLENLQTLSLGYFPAEGEETPPAIDLSPAGTLSVLSKVFLGGLAFTHLEALEKVQNLRIWGADVDSLEPLGEFNQLFQLELEALTQGDLPPLSNLVTLNFLRLYDLPLTSLAPLAGLPALELLHLESLPFSSFEGLEDLPKLRHMSLLNLSFDTFAGLQNLPSLRVIDLENCPAVESLDGLESCENLENVLSSGSAGSNITDVSALAEMPSLRNLSLNSAKVADLGPVAECPGLQALQLMDNELTDLSPLAEHPGLTALLLSDNQISDLTPLAGLPLKTLHISGNQVVSIEALSGMPLVSLTISNNPIQAFDSIATLQELSFLYMDGVGATSLEFLRDSAISTLHAADNQLTDVDALVQPFGQLNLRNNQISELPTEFVGVTSGCGTTDLLDNPLSESATALLESLCAARTPTSPGSMVGYLWDADGCEASCPNTP